MLLNQLENHSETILHHINTLHGCSPVPYSLRAATTLNYQYKVDEVIPDIDDLTITLTWSWG